MKRTYIQPEVQVAQIEMESMILAGSAAPSGPSMGINKVTTTTSQW